MTTAIEQLSSLVVGVVDSVSPGEISGHLLTDAPGAVALNTGLPRRFPRINSYVLIGSGSEWVVGVIEWVGIANAPLTAAQAREVIDLPFPRRRLRAVPLGTLRTQRNPVGDAGRFKLDRGVASFPSVGDEITIPTDEQLRCIVESQGSDARLRVGVAPLASDAEVRVDPNKLFGHHLAVLGNTGSGKSCTVAGLLRWSIEAASAKAGADAGISSRFIVLDPNGEYSKAFRDMGDVVDFYAVDPRDGEDRLVVPGWIWNGDEWSSFARASAATQRPLLLRALREMRAGTSLTSSVEVRLWATLRAHKVSLEARLNEGLKGYAEWPGPESLTEVLGTLGTTLTDRARDMQEGAGKSAIGVLMAAIRAHIQAKKQARPRGGFNYLPYAETDVETLIAQLDTAMAALGIQEDEFRGSEDAPIPFNVEALADYLEVLAQRERGNVAQYIATLTMRIRLMLNDERMRQIAAPDNEPKFEDWLGGFLGRRSANDKPLAIIDLSLVPSEIIHLVTAVISRTIFEALQRYRRLHQAELPTVLVLEEAHTFVTRDSQDEGSTAEVCRKQFERIAREGRKFGMSLVLSSQRPSELSPTVLAQCNSFMLHRLVNDRDQDLVRRLIPDNLAGLMRELPILPTGHALLLGHAATAPVLVKVDHLPEDQRPRSENPKFWEVWTGEESREIGWGGVAADWIGGGAQDDPSGSGATASDEEGVASLMSMFDATPVAPAPPPTEDDIPWGDDPSSAQDDDIPF